MTVPMIETRINGKWDLLLPEHRAARAEWISGWEVARLDSMHANLNPGMLVYDIGAEEGDLPALWASWGCDVVLVEPNPRVWPNIKAIFDGNDLPGQVRGWFVGLASDQDRLTPAEVSGPLWALDPRQHGPGPAWPECAYGEVIGDHGFKSLADSRGVLPEITLDTLAGWYGPPDAVTMDVEGGEVFVARGMTGMLSSDRPPLVWVSVHPETMVLAFNVYSNEFFTEFHKHGYVKALLDWDHELHVIFWRPDVHDPVLPCVRHGYDCP